jgi:hypothetical protein
MLALIGLIEICPPERTNVKLMLVNGKPRMFMFGGLTEKLKLPVAAIVNDGNVTLELKIPVACKRVPDGTEMPLLFSWALTFPPAEESSRNGPFRRGPKIRSLAMIKLPVSNTRNVPPADPINGI